MALITHGSDLGLAPTIRPLAGSAGGDPRRALKSVVDAGFSSVQLDATMPGVRPRELDASARRDLAATLRRTVLAPAGIDFFIPAEHYLDQAHIDRAVDSAHAAMSLAADLGRVPLSLNVPVLEVEAQLIEGLLAAADGLGVRLAIHYEADPVRLLDWLTKQDERLIGAGLDPAALLSARHDPIVALQGFGDRLSVARLSDAKCGQADGVRSVLGQGDLDLMAYRVSVDLAPRRVGPVVLDLRMLADPLSAAKTAAHAWQSAAMRM